jgi:hypothetical protein
LTAESFFQPLEQIRQNVPTLGKFTGKSSNHWTLSPNDSAVNDSAKNSPLLVADE